jgi:hypothetical protein
MMDNQINEAEGKIIEMLKVAGLPKKPSYSPGEVCLILGISDRTFWRLINNYEKDFDTGKPIKPYSLDSYMIARSHRVRFNELVDYLERNNTYERVNG